MSETEGEWRRVTDLQVASQGRIQIPLAAARRHGIEVGDVVEARVYHEDHYIPLGLERIKSQRRISLPRHQFEAHDLIGEYVDVEIRKTGQRWDP